MSQTLVLYVDSVPNYHLSKGLVYIRGPVQLGGAELPQFDILAPWDIFEPAVDAAGAFVAAVRAGDHSVTRFQRAAPKGR